MVGERDLIASASSPPLMTQMPRPRASSALKSSNQTRHGGLARVGWMFTLTATAYDLVQLSKLVALWRSHGRTLLVSIALLCTPPILGQLPRTGFNLH